jgi:hypothetical protein
MSEERDQRVEILEDLIQFKLNPTQAVEKLAGFDWDSPVDLVQLSRKDLVQAIGRYTEGRWSATDLCDWAEALESREDVGFESELVQDVLFEISNPTLFESVTIESAKSWSNRLRFP